MMPVETSTGVPEWMGETAFWLSVGSFLAASAAAAGVWTLVARLRDLAAAGGRLATLAEIDQKLGRLVAARDDLDLRRLEHLLVDVRDTQRRLEDGLLRTTEMAHAARAPGTDLAVAAGPDSIGERIVNRLLALGFEQVQIVTRAEKMSELLRRDGDVLVEARRGGVLHKGRVILRSGRLADVEVHPAYSIFP